MFDLNNYLATGVVESYCLGNLPEREAHTLLELAAQHPELQAEIDATLGTLQKYSTRRAANPDLKNRTLNFLSTFLAKEMIDLDQPPLISKYSDATAWHDAVKELQPDMQEGDMAVRFLKDTPDVELNIVWLYGELVEDEHPSTEFVESFLILEGACECDFEGQIVRFSAGDYFDVPPGVKHVIKNISENKGFVKGIVQRRKAA